LPGEITRFSYFYQNVCTIVRIRLFSLFLLLTAFPVAAQFYNGSQLEFGKNRVQYKPLEWSFYRYDRYDVFFFAGGKELSQLAASVARKVIPELEQRFDYTLENRVQLLIFTRLSDLKQSNLGIEQGSQNNLGGTVRQVGNKVLLYYENGTVSFVRQIKDGLAEVMVNEFLFGSDYRDRLRSSTLMNVPEWFDKGLVRWLAEPWDRVVENQVRDGIITGRYLRFGRLYGEDAVVAGQSMWNYIANTYGERVIPDILELTRLNRSVEAGLQTVLGIGLKSLTQEWLNYYDKKYYYNDTLYAVNKGTKISGKYRPGYIYRQARLGPDGKAIAWVRNDHGKSTIWLKEDSVKRARKIIRSGRRLPNLTDYTFPQLAWHPNNELLLYTDEYKGRLRLSFYNRLTRKTERKFLNNIEKLIDFDVSPDGKRFAITAVKDGKTDLFIFNNVSNTLEQITADFWDESSPKWMQDGESILFSSNRINDTLFSRSVAPFFQAAANDLFIYEPAKDRKVLRRITNTPSINESQPFTFGNNEIAYLSDANGIANRYVARFDSTIAFIDTITHYRYFIVPRPLTNYKRNILEHAIGRDGKFTEILYFKGSPSVYQGVTAASWPENSILPGKAYVPPPSVPKSKMQHLPAASKVKKIVVFGEDTGSPPTTSTADTAVVPEVQKDTFKLSRQRVYETAYYTEYLVTQIDRGFLNQSYQPYNGANGYINPPVNGLFRIGLSDLFEDYKITGGVRLSGNLTGNEYLLAFQKLKTRLDKTIIFHRQGIQNSLQDPSRAMIHTVTGRLSYPFSEVARVSGSLSYRNDRLVYLANDLANLSRPNAYMNWMQAKTEFVFDNTFPLSLNMMTGTRAKLTVEHFRQLSDSKASTTVIGGDFRHYIRLTRELIFAGRVAAATSVGPGKVLFYLGGVDNWFVPRFDYSVAPDDSQNYLFQTVGTNMRGFYQNIRNGSSFGVVNAELRWNILRYFFKYPLKSDFLNSMQLVTFGDVGTAFTGNSPYSEDNTFNKQVITNGPITIILKNLHEPIVGGTGFGLRTRLLGYFVRADVAWGIEDGRRLPPLFYLSLCTDF